MLYRIYQIFHSIKVIVRLSSVIKLLDNRQNSHTVKKWFPVVQKVPVTKFFSD